MLAREAFDVSVSDIGMPVRDGYALMAEVWARGIRTPALAVTAFARAEDRAKSMSSGYQAHISKPLVIAELLATFASLAYDRRGDFARRVARAEIAGTEP